MRDVTSIGRLAASLVICALSLAYAGLVAAQPFGYIVNAADPTDDGSHDNLWRLDLATGLADNIGPINLPNASNPQSDVEGLALQTNSRLYGVDDAIDSLVLIAIATGSAQVLDRPVDNLRLNLLGSQLDPGLAFDCDGDLLMSSATRRTLYRLNRQTGEASVVGGQGLLGAQIGDISVRGEEIFGIGINGDEGLYRIDGETGEAELVGLLDVDLSLINVGVDFDTSGNLWAVGHIIDNQGQPQPSRIFRVDRETGKATLRGTTLVGVKSLAIRPPRCNLDNGSGPGGPETPRGNEPAGVPLTSPFGLLVLALALLAIGRRRLI